MPYSVETDHPDCSGFAVTKDDDGTLMGCHTTQAEANKQIAALYASEADQTNSRNEVILVWGPPCSGKSTYVFERAQRGDLILDADNIHAALSGLEIHDHVDSVSTFIQNIWDSMLRQIENSNTTAWVIMGVPTRNQREELGETITSTRFIYAERDVCHARAKEANRPEQWHSYIDRWFNEFEPTSERSESMNIERRTATEGVELREEGETLTAVGYAAVFDRLSQNLGGFVERIAPGAFRSTLKQADVRALFNHEADHLLGRSSTGTLRMMEDEHGLRYEVDLPNTSLGRDVAELLRRGDISGSSFGFRTISDEFSTTEDNYPLRTLTEVALRDVGPVTFPAYTDTEASLRNLADSRSLKLSDLVEAADSNMLTDFLNNSQDAPATEEPSETHSDVVKRSWAIR